MYQALSECGIKHITPTTIHSLLRAMPDGDGQWHFSIDGVNEYVDANLLVIDEASMADNELMLSLLRATKPGTKIIIIGDPYQLPPVGRGTFLRDWQLWCDSTGGERAKYGLLTEIRRNQGRIVESCAEIRVGRTPRLNFCSKIYPAEITNDNLRMIDAKDEEEIQKIAVAAADDLVGNFSFGSDLILYSTGKKVDPIWDFQVIVATNKETPASKDALNPLLQDVLNPNGQQALGKFRTGDKVICRTNGRHPGKDSGRELYAANGAFGLVTGFDSRSIFVRLEDYPDEPIAVPRGDMSSGFDLGYAVTCHRMQGSQAPIVFVCLSPTYKAKMVADRSWLYTAITRAQELAIVAGELDTVRDMCRRTKIMERVSFIPQWLTEYGDNGQAKDCTVQSSL
jgi:exodeoxyribonuclease V alpha subunit